MLACLLVCLCMYVFVGMRLFDGMFVCSVVCGFCVLLIVIVLVRVCCVFVRAFVVFVCFVWLLG